MIPHKILLITIIVVILFSSLIFAETVDTTKPPLPRIAVIDFEAIGSGVDREFGKGVSEILSSALIKSRKYRVIERTALTKVLKEQKLQMTDLVDQDKIVAFGKILGAEIIVTGSIIKMGKSYTITPRFIEVQTATAKESENLTCANEEEIPQMCNRIISILIKETQKTPEESWQAKEEPEYVSQSSDGRFKVRRDGIILDTKTDLMWAPDPGGDKTWEQAKEYAENLTLGGYTDWRLPTRAELKGLYETSKEHTPYGHEDWSWTVKIDPVFKFSGYYAWSSELYESGGSSGAWFFSFINGYESWGYRVYSFASRVLGVRSRR